MELHAYSSLASIRSQVPSGLFDVEVVDRQQKTPSASIESGKVTTAPENQPLNSIPSQRVPDVTGAGMPSQVRAGDETDSTEQQQQQLKIDQVINQLKARDREVRAHEQAHLSVAGSYATGLSYSYQVGPDGKQYAIGGSVGIDTSPIPGDPEATLQKAMTVQSAALAPAQPSAQDFRVASSAGQMAAEARSQITEQRNEPINNTKQAGQSTTESEAADQTNSSNNESVMIAERAAFNTRLQMPTGHELVADLVNPEA